MKDLGTPVQTLDHVTHTSQAEEEGENRDSWVIGSEYLTLM